MLVLWHSTQQISYYVQYSLPTAQLIYTGKLGSDFILSFWQLYLSASSSQLMLFYFRQIVIRILPLSIA